MLALKESEEEENILAITDGSEGGPKEIVVGAPPKVS
jgi:hypothetical protein